MKLDAEVQDLQQQLSQQVGQSKWYQIHGFPWSHTKDTVSVTTPATYGQHSSNENTTSRRVQ